MLDPFAIELYRLINARGLSLREFARLAKTKQPALSEIKRGVRPVPLARVERWADVLELAGDDRERFLDLAHLTQTPDRIRLLIAGVEQAQGKAMRRLLVKGRK